MNNNRLVKSLVKYIDNTIVNIGVQDDDGVSHQYYCSAESPVSVNESVWKLYDHLTDSSIEISINDIVNFNFKTEDFGDNNQLMMEEIDALRTEYQERKDVLIDALKQEPIDAIKCELKMADIHDDPQPASTLAEILSCQHRFQRAGSGSGWSKWIQNKIFGDNITESKWLDIIRIYRDYGLEVLDREEVIAKADDDQDAVEELSIIKQMLRDVPQNVSLPDVDDIHNIKSCINTWPPILLPVPRILQQIR